MTDADEPITAEFEPFELFKSHKTAIGEIILIGSEIDHLATIALFKTAAIHADIGFSLFGRMTFGSKIKQLRMLLKAEQNR